MRAGWRPGPFCCACSGLAAYHAHACTPGPRPPLRCSPRRRLTAAGPRLWYACPALLCRPPELITEGILTKSADVYAFGVITWEIYVGRRARGCRCCLAWAGQTCLVGFGYSARSVDIPAAKKRGFSCLICLHGVPAAAPPARPAHARHACPAPAFPLPPQARVGGAEAN